MIPLGLQDAAANWSFPCGASATCVNTQGSFECVCPAGFTGDPQRACSDINECGLTTTCSANAKCLNVPGSFKCFCPPGFEGDGRQTCSS